MQGIAFLEPPIQSITVSFGMYKVGTEYRINMGEEVLHFTFLLCVLQFFSSASQTRRPIKSACDTDSSKEYPMLCKKAQLCAISLTGCVKRDWCNPILVPSLIAIQLIFLF